MINFLAEISKLFEVAINPTPSSAYARNYDIYELDIRKPENRPEDEYWGKIWGGTYDNFTGTDIEIYYSKFLTKVSESEVLTAPFSMFMRDGIVYLNVPIHTWLYPDYAVEGRDVIPFLSAPLNPDKPSDLIINDKQASVRLDIPNVNIKLSDSFFGISLQQGFSIGLTNNDGYFDDEEKWDLFNIPVILKKSTKEVSAYADFREIRSGLIDSVLTSFDKFQITASDKLRAMDEPVCNVVSGNRYRGVNIDAAVLGKNIPIVYGTKKIKLLKLNSTQYIAAEEITGVSHVYNRDGALLMPGVGYSTNLSTGIITSISGHELDTAVITGYTNNKIGEIIQDIVAKKTNIPYGLTSWNTEEVEQYAYISPRINIEINSGDVKKAINEILKSDMAYFIQQLDGRFTIRRYGNTYKTHFIPAWPITQKPEKDYDKAQDNYFSSCIIRYDFTDKETFKSYVYNERENEAEDKYHKRTSKTFDTDLFEIADVHNFARLLGERYISLKQTIKLPVGIDTSGIDLLDTVIIGVNVNGRKFSGSALYIVKETNPSQDILTLEALDSLFAIDLTGEYPHTDEAEYIVIADNKYAYTQDKEFEFSVEGGRP